MGQARRNKTTGRTNPPRIFTSANLMEPVREAVLGELKKGKPKPSVIVVDATTEGTNWMPRLVDDVSGVPGLPAAMRMYKTLDEFDKDEVWQWHPEIREKARRALTAHPEDVVLITLDDHGVGITDIEMTAKALDGRELTSEQLSAALAKREGMDELLHEGAKRAVDVYGLDWASMLDRKDATQDDLTLLTKGLLNVVVERVLAGREEGYHPAVMGIFPEDGDCEVGCWDTMEKFERTRNESARHRVWKEQVREAAAEHPGCIVVCWPVLDTPQLPLLLTAKETQSGWTVWAVDTKSMQIERVVA